MKPKNLRNKYRLGPGGISCACCTKMHPTKLKVAVRRYYRRLVSRSLRERLAEAEASGEFPTVWDPEFYKY